MISIIILTWNGKRFLDDCLTSLISQTFRDFETILVDNGSTDGSAEYVRKIYPWVRLVALPENVGFAAGNNKGFIEAHGEYIVTLNNDTKVEPGFLAAMMEAAERGGRIGMVAAKMLNYFEHGRIDAVGVIPAYSGLGLSLGYGEWDAGQYDQMNEVFGPCGGAALYRRAMLDEVGFFDEDFFAYYEDLDLAWRGRLAGWQAVHAPRAVVYHMHSATSGRKSSFTVHHLQRNKWFTILKNWPAALILKNLPHILLYDLGGMALALLKGRGVAALRARQDVVRNFKRLLVKRREIQAKNKLSPEEIAVFFTKSKGVFHTFSRKLRED